MRSSLRRKGLKASKCLQQVLQARSGQKPLRSQEKLRNGLYRIAHQFIHASEMLLGSKPDPLRHCRPPASESPVRSSGRFSPKLFPGDFPKHLYTTLSQVPLSKKERRTEDPLQGPNRVCPSLQHRSRMGPPKSTWNWRSPSSEAPLRAGKR